MIYFTDHELALIKASVEAVDWDYSGNGSIAASVLRKIRDEARRILQSREKEGSSK